MLLWVHHTSLSCFCFSLLTLLLTIYWPTLPPSFLTQFSSIPHHHSQNYYYIHSICVNYLYKMEEKKEPLLLQQQREIDDDNVFWAKFKVFSLFSCVTNNSLKEYLNHKILSFFLKWNFSYVPHRYKRKYISSSFFYQANE